MHLTVFLKRKNPKNSLFWANIYKKPKKNKKPKKTKKTKNPTGLVIFFLNPGFFQPWNLHIPNQQFRNSLGTVEVVEGPNPEAEFINVQFRWGFSELRFPYTMFTLQTSFQPLLLQGGE